MSAFDGVIALLRDCMESLTRAQSVLWSMDVEHKELTRKLAKAEHDRDRYAAEIGRLRTELRRMETCQCPACRPTVHASSCAVHGEPAMPNGECDCGASSQAFAGRRTGRNDPSIPTDAGVPPRDVSRIDLIGQNGNEGLHYSAEDST